MNTSASQSFHIKYTPPHKTEYVDRPNGCWSLYRITGDEIADSIVRETVVWPENGRAYYSGKVIARHRWPGFIGLFEDLDELMEAIKTV